MQMAKNHLCIPSSAITSSRMSRNDVLPCISTGNLVSRLGSIGQEILQQSLIRIPVRSPKPMFVGVMTYSQYAYVETFLDMKQKSWINAHVHMYEYFGGVAKILIPDNCKTAVVPQWWL